MKTKSTSLFFLVVLSLLLVSCAPSTFVRTMSPGWNSIEFRDGVTYQDAWKSTVDIIAKKFDIEILSQEDGYLRTGWLYTWTGRITEYYKVRAILKFVPDQQKLDIKTEAQYWSGGFLGIGQGWMMGEDRLLTETMKTDIMGVIGRTAR